MAARKPLTEKHLEVLNNLIKETMATDDIIAKCEGCGLDVDKEKSLNAEQRKVAENLKREFFPGTV